MARFHLTVLISIALACVALPSAAQTAPDGQPEATTTQQTPQWTGLPFSSLADYERLIPVGMSREDLVHVLGRPEAVMPGRGADQVYHYAYQLEGGSELRAVIIVRDGAVFIRRLYESSPEGATSRAN
jgi:outer membrane protein assembly factor BamE (lipoprotein component of BamABCDE complex)